MVTGAFDRLTVRLATGIILLVLVPFGSVLYALSKHHYDNTIESRRQAAHNQNRILEATLRHQMMAKDTSLLTALVQDIGAQPDVRNAMIVGHDGTIRFASRPEAVGRVLAVNSPTCLVCHSKNPENRDDWVLLEEEGSPSLRSVLPIENREECHACHDPGNRLNGILILDLALEDVQAQLRTDAKWMTAGSAILALVVLAGMGLLVRHLILVRLRRLQHTVRAVATGSLGERAHVLGNDVISSLASDFNRMAESLAVLFREVKAQETQLSGVINGLDDGLVVLDRDLKVVASNRSFCRKVGQHPEFLRNRSCREGVEGALPCCAMEGACPARQCLQTGEVQRAMFTVDSSAGAADIVHEVYASPVYDEGGNIVHVVELWRDISARVREEERLAEIERLVSLGVLASGFSHEVNTPLASMLICAESALATIGEQKEVPTATPVLESVRAQLEIVRREVMRCRRITEQFLRFSRGVPPSIEPIDLQAVVESVVALAAPTAREAGATITIKRAPSIPAVQANTEVVQHVILNLLVNAIQSLEGPVRVVTVSLHVDERVSVRIADTGCGVPEADRKYLFEPFRSQKPQGTGLGLFLSRRLMRRFDGDVRLVASEVGVGSCFEVRFCRAGGEKP